MNDYIKEIRKLVGSVRIHIPGVRAIIVNDVGEVLLQRRMDTGFWGLPAGAVELGESAMEALKREVAEETALAVLKAEPMALYSGQKQQFTYPNGDRVQGFALVFIIRQWEGRLSADGIEGSELRFFPLSNLPKDLTPIHEQVLEDYGKFNGKFFVS